MVGYRPSSLHSCWVSTPPALSLGIAVLAVFREAAESMQRAGFLVCTQTAVLLGK